jgi:hypothetical protein
MHSEPLHYICLVRESVAQIAGNVPPSQFHLEADPLLRETLLRQLGQLSHFLTQLRRTCITQFSDAGDGAWSDLIDLR